MRTLGCWRAVVPARDGVTYLWMAEQWAAGNSGELLANVFSPGYPLVVGLLLKVCPWFDTVGAGQFVAAGCSALAVVPHWCA